MASNSPSPSLPDAPRCPFCDGTRTEIMSLFGSHASLTTCWCADCRSPFEFLRWRAGQANVLVVDDGQERENMDHGKRVE